MKVFEKAKGVVIGESTLNLASFIGDDWQKDTIEIPIIKKFQKEFKDLKMTFRARTQLVSNDTKYEILYNDAIDYL